ncbi:hypothetical protein [Piscinibacter defluvii]|uniref:hypothetical protein n=1 Tax=Piscinibacter defluvii TaxID=1796922 RepID=UPI000FDD3FCB|nr:hypothetical protein [Piscinibacter defluvii]
MFGRNKPVVLDRYGHRRSRLRIPRWLVLLLLGVATGAGGLVYLQENHLPKRLSAAASVELQQAYTQADAERTQLRADLAATTKKLEAALTEAKTNAAELATSRQTVERLRTSLDFVAGALPPDPRGGTVEVRAAQFTAQGGKLDYDVLLFRDKGAKPMPAVVQIVVAGEGASGTATNVSLKPTAVSVGRLEAVGGNVPLPEGFRPRQATVNVLDRPDGRLLGMRVLYVK